MSIFFKSSFKKKNIFTWKFFHLKKKIIANKMNRNNPKD